MAIYSFSSFREAFARHFFKLVFLYIFSDDVSDKVFTLIQFLNTGEMFFRLGVCFKKSSVKLLQQTRDDILSNEIYTTMKRKYTVFVC